MLVSRMTVARRDSWRSGEWTVPVAGDARLPARAKRRANGIEQLR